MDCRYHIENKVSHQIQSVNLVVHLQLSTSPFWTVTFKDAPFWTVTFKDEQITTRAAQLSHNGSITYDTGSTVALCGGYLLYNRFVAKSDEPSQEPRPDSNDRASREPATIQENLAVINHFRRASVNEVAELRLYVDADARHSARRARPN